MSRTMAELSQYLCQMQLQLQVAHGAQFMALARIQMIAVDILFILYHFLGDVLDEVANDFFRTLPLLALIGGITLSN